MFILDKYENINYCYEMRMISQDITQEKFNIIYTCLKDLTLYYPSFEDWYFRTVADGLQNNSRKIILEERNGEIAGIAIVKKNVFEKKICTIKVMDDFINRGIGIRLFERSMSYLETTSPLLTVDEDRLPFFQKIFDKYGFKQTQILHNYYKDGKKEFVFNGIMIDDPSSKYLMKGL